MPLTTLPSLNRTSTAIDMPSLFQETQRKHAPLSNTFVPVPADASLLKKKQFISPENACVSFTKAHEDEIAAEVPFAHSFYSSQTSNDLAPSKIQRALREARQFAEVQMVKSESSATFRSPLYIETKETSPHAYFSENKSPKQISERDSFSAVTPEPDKQLLTFSISQKDLKTIDPLLNFSDPAPYAIKQARAKLDQCIDFDPTILESTGSTRTNKIKEAVEKLSPSKRSFQSSPVSIETTFESERFLEMQSPKKIAETLPEIPSPTSSKKNNFSTEFSCSREDLKVIDPTLNPSKLDLKAIRRARAKWDKCIDLDSTICESTGSSRKNKLKTALEKLFPKASSFSLQTESTDSAKTTVASDSFSDDELSLTSSSIKSDFDAFSVSPNDLKIVDPTLDFLNPETNSIKRARAKWDKCIDLDPTILASSGSARKEKIKKAVENLTKSSSFLLPVI